MAPVEGVVEGGVGESATSLSSRGTVFLHPVPHVPADSGQIRREEVQIEVQRLHPILHRFLHPRLVTL